MFARSIGLSFVVAAVFGMEGRAMTWATPPVAREQLVLFPTSLDAVEPAA